MSEHDPNPGDRSAAAGLAALLRGPLAHADDTEGFIESVNHHLRSPLTVILGHVELWIGQHQEFPTELRDSLGVVARAGWRIADVGAAICDLIDAASVRPGTTSPFEVHTLLSEAVTGRGPAQRSVELGADCAQATWCIGDPARLERALGELLDNALTWAPDGSTVTVAATGTSSVLRISVTDEGPGIEPDRRQRMVRPFEQVAHPARSGVATGMGMGLTVASAVAASHGGLLRLSSGTRGGLRACLEVPLDCTPFLQRVDTETTPGPAAPRTRSAHEGLAATRSGTRDDPGGPRGRAPDLRQVATTPRPGAGCG